jgi:hypothetical protein
MVVYSTSKKLRVQHGNTIIKFIDGVYYYDKPYQKNLFKILSAVSPTESIITDQNNNQINKPKLKSKAKKVKGDKDAS